MSKFMNLGLNRPATLGAVLEAVVRLGAQDESQVLALASAGKLEELFPFRPAKSAKAVDDFVPEQELVDASPLPLNAEERTRLIESSLPKSSSRATPQREVMAHTKRTSARPLATGMTTGKKSKR